ncbi:MAG: glycosyltransferase family 39 protein [Anaerolineae bacterium]|nr:glycosyltransferase family 39 protein [Anaerolineae bacterium]
MRASLRRWWNASIFSGPESATERMLVGTVAVLVFALMVIPGLNRFSLWLDEVNMANVAQVYLRGLLQTGRIGGSQPLLYFVLLKGWSLAVGETDLALRAFSVLTATLSAALVYRIAVDFSRRAFGGLAAVLLFGAMGFIHYHVHQVHIRGLVLMLTMALLLFYERWWSHPSSKRYAIGVIVTSFASIYTHYYGAFVILALNLHALVIGVRRWKDLQKWIVIQVAAVLFLLPLIPGYITFETNDASGVSPSLERVTSLQGVDEQSGTIIFPNTFPTDLPTIVGTLDTMIAGRADVYAALLGLGLVGLIVLTRQSRDRFPLRPLGLLLVYLLGSLGFALLSNLWVQSFMDRRVIFLLPGLAILIGYLLATLPKPIGWTALIVAGSITLVTGWSIKLPGNWYFRQALEVVEDDWQANDAILFQFKDMNEYIVKPLNYYAKRMFPSNTPILTLGNYTLDNDHNKSHFANQVVANPLWTRNRLWIIRSGDPALGLTSTDWLDELEGKRFVEERAVPVGWMIVSLFAAEPTEHHTLQGAIEPSRKPPLPQSFGDTFELVDYQIDRLTARPDEKISLWLDWRTLRPLDQDYAVYVHLLEDNTILHGQTDRDPAHLGRPVPTTFWAVDVLIYDTCTLTVNKDTPPGEYQLKVGFYSRIDGTRMPVPLSDGSTSDGLVLATIEVR